ncbi:hypothetical protein [Anaplasma bovis]|uniref:hypothetical protein n=1 Tax=Anaplasma bovis TaxID=186733 RepID=UPI002FF13866
MSDVTHYKVHGAEKYSSNLRRVNAATDKWRLYDMSCAAKVRGPHLTVSCL